MGVTTAACHTLIVGVTSYVSLSAGVPNFGPVGRLDFDTSGLLLFTDDYKLKRAISSPT